MKNLLVLVLFAIALCGCSSTKEISSEETTTIKPMKVEVPEVNAEINLDNKMLDDSEEPFGIYEGGKTVESKTEDGTTVKSKVTTTVSIQKNAKGKTEVKANISVKTDSIDTKAKVIQKKTSTQKETKGFFDGLTGLIKWSCVFIILLAVIWIVLKVKKFI